MDMKAVILAAGRGTRMPRISKEKPKCLIKIGDRSILHRQIHHLKNNDIHDIYIVIGYKSDIVKRSIEENTGIHFLENKEYATTDNIYSLYLTKRFVNGKEFILLNGDVVCEEEIIRKVLEKENENVVPIDSKYYDLEELKVRIEDNLVKEILPKNAPKEKSDGSTIGIFKFSPKGSKMLFDEIERCVKQEIKNKWFEFAVNRILPELRMIPIDIHGLKWIEVDTEDDILRAEKMFGE